MPNILKTLNNYWRIIITYLLIVICFGALAFCLLKVTYALLSKPLESEKRYPFNQRSATQFNKTFAPKTSLQKDAFFLSLQDFIPHFNQTELIEGQTYFILKTNTSTPSRECIFGAFKLLKKNPHQFNFAVLNTFKGKKFEQYSVMMGQQIKYKVLKQEQIFHEVLNCRNWVSIQNTYQLASSTQNNNSKTKVIQFKKSKCESISSQNILAIKSDAPNILYFQYNSIKNRIQMCLRKSGVAKIHILSANSPNFQTEIWQVQN